MMLRCPTRNSRNTPSSSFAGLTPAFEADDRGKPVREPLSPAIVHSHLFYGRADYGAVRWPVSRACEEGTHPEQEQAIAALGLALDEAEREQDIRVRWLLGRSGDG